MMKASLIFSESPRISHTIVFQNILGQGKVKVYHVKRLSSSEPDLALKIFPKEPSSSHHFTKEKGFLSRVNHPYIIRHIPILKHDLPHDLIATEYTPYGDFFDLVTQGCLTSEKIVRTYFHQLIEGVSYLHKQGVAHLDLKLENLLLGKDLCLRILDFDQSQNVDETNLCSAGTEDYSAPELLNKCCKDLRALDIYTLGVILYAFLTGELPFIEKKDPKINMSDRYESFRIEKERFWREKGRVNRRLFTKEQKEILNGMWEENVELRMKIDDIKRTKWYNGDVCTEEELKTDIRKVLHRVRGQKDFGK